MKTVEFQGLTFEVPDWARWIAQDGDASIYVYECEPIKDLEVYIHTKGKMDSVVIPSAPMTLKEIK